MSKLRLREIVSFVVEYVSYILDDRTKKDFVSPDVRIFVLNHNTARSILIGLCLHLLALGAKYKK